MNIEKAARRASVLFEHEGWTYHDGSPDQNRLEKVIAGLLENLRDDTTETETGRLVAFRRKEEGGEEIKICLVLGEEWHPNEEPEPYCPEEIFDCPCLAPREGKWWCHGCEDWFNEA